MKKHDLLRSMAVSHVDWSGYLAAALLLMTPFPLSAQEPTLRATLTHQRGELRESPTVAFSSDGKTLASASGSTVKLWNVSTRKQTASLARGSGLVFCVALSPDGTLLASGNSDSTVTLWNVARRKETATLDLMDEVGPQRFARFPYSVAFSNDGNTLASTCGTAVKLWDVGTRKELATLEGHSRDVLAVAFSNNGKLLAAGGKDSTVKLWDVTIGQVTSTLKGHDEAVWSVAFSRDGTLLASGGGSTVVVWDVSLSRKKATLQQPFTFPVRSVAFSGDGTTVASATSGVVWLWNVSGKRKANVNCRHLPRAVAFGGDGSLLAVGGRVSESRATIFLWDIPSNE